MYPRSIKDRNIYPVYCEKHVMFYTAHFEYFGKVIIIFFILELYKGIFLRVQNDKYF